MVLRGEPRRELHENATRTPPRQCHRGKQAQVVEMERSRLELPDSRASGIDAGRVNDRFEVRWQIDVTSATAVAAVSVPAGSAERAES